MGDSDGRRPAMWAAAMRGAGGTLVASACFVGTVLHGLFVVVEVTSDVSRSVSRQYYVV